MGAWVQAGSSIARATAKITGVVLRRFWPLVLIALAVLGGLLALVIVNLSGASQVWASLVTVAAVVGASDDKGEGPRDKAITPDDIAATFYTALGIDPRKEYHTPSGRPVMITRPPSCKRPKPDVTIVCPAVR